MGQTAGTMTWQMIFLMIVGIVMVVAGISNLSEFLHINKTGTVFNGEVVKSVHRTLRDKKNNLIQYYWELTVRYFKPDELSGSHASGRTISATVKSTTQYEAGEKIRVTEKDDKVTPIEDFRNNGRSGLMLLAAGVGVVAAPPVSTRSEAAASWILSLVFLCLGLALYFTYKKESVTGMEPVEGTIKELILFQTDREKRQVAGSKHWYPLISYQNSMGEERQFLSRINSNYKSTFKIGSAVQLYRDPATGAVLERKPSKLMLAAAIAMFAIAVLGAVSTLMV